MNLFYSLNCLNKTKFAILSLLLIAGNMIGQTIASYNFSQSNGTYSAITGGTLHGTAIDDAAYSFTLPFTFTYKGTGYTAVKPVTNGFLVLGTSTPSSTTYTPISGTSTGFNQAISALGRDLNSSVRSEVIGTSPNRVYVCQWSSAYRYAVGSSENLNFQVRLYETTNEIEIIYGTMTTTNTSLTTGVSQIGLRGAANTDFNVVSFTNSALTGYTYTNSWNNLITASGNTDGLSNTTTIFPASGSILKWIPSTCAQPTVSASATSITTSSFTVGWTNSAIYTSGYNVRWRRVDDLPSVATWTTPISVAAGSSSYTIASLSPNTYYIYSVEGLCSGISRSNFSQVTTINSTNARGLVQTLATCPGVPTALTSNTITTTTANIAWTAASPAPGSGYEYYVSSSAIAPIASTVATGSVGAGIVTASLSSLTQSTLYYFWVRSNCNGTDKSSWSTSSTFTTLAACPGIPTALTSNSLTTTTANIAWTAASPAPGSGYEYYVSTSSTAPVSGTTPTGTVAAGVTTDALSGLSPNTLYYFWVRSNCNGTDKSVWSTVGSFRTLCNNEAAPTANQGFATFIPSCWTTATGAIATPSTLTYVANEWVSVSGMGNTGSNAAVKTNLYGTNVGEWIISQPIDLGITAGLYRLNYKIAVTSYNGTTSQSTLGTHQVRVIISTNGGSTWNLADVIKTYTGAATYSNTGQTETIDLTSYSGVIKVAFVSTTSSTATDIDFHIDDFIVEPIPTCYNPATVSSTNITTTSATINWTAPSGGTAPTGYNYEVRTSGAAGSGATGLIASGSTASTTLTAAISGLTANTTYTYYVQNDCGSGSTSSWNSNTFFTGYCTPSSTSVDGTGITNVTFGLTPNIVNNTTGSESATGYYGNYSSQIGNLYVGQNATFTSTFTTSTYPYTYNIYIDLNNDLDFIDAGETVYSGVSSTSSSNVVSFLIPSGTSLGNHRIRIAGGDGSAPSSCATGLTYSCFEDYTCNIVTPPACNGAPTAGSATSTLTNSCAGAASSFNLGLTGGTSGVSGLEYQWESSPAGLNTWSNLGASQTTSSYTVSSISASTDYRLRTKCTATNDSVTSSPIAVTIVDCQYNVAKNSITYNSIMSTGSTYTSISNVDDGRTNVVSLTGTSFKFKGQPITGFYATTNGWLSFNTSLLSTSYTNDLTATGQNRVLAPFWDDLYIKGGLAANYNSCMRYQINGTLGSGSAEIIIEWAEMERYQFPSPNLNFQVVLKEAGNEIHYNYGNMQLYAGDSNTTGYSYTVGMNGSSPSTFNISDRMCQKRTNYPNFTDTSITTLNETPECNSQILFSPAASYTGGMPPAASAPANDDQAGAIGLSVNQNPCLNLCGSIYSSKLAIASASVTACAGNEDDDVWFSFNSAGGIRITVTPSLGYDAAYQLIDNIGNIVDCKNSSAVGKSEDSIYTFLSAGSYYLRVWDTATGSSGSGEFAVCISEVISPPSNDDTTGALSLTVSNICSTTNSLLPNSLGATASAGVMTCSAGTPGVPDDDQWFKFTTNNDSGVRYRITVKGTTSAYNPVVQLFKNGTSLACVNATAGGGTETITNSALDTSAEYYIRVYHSGVGAGDGSFSICITADTPGCVIQTSPINNNQVTTGTASLTWTRVVGATSYEIYGGTTNPPSTLIATQPGDSSTFQYSVSSNSVYYWSIKPKNSFVVNSLCVKVDSFNTYPPCIAPTILFTTNQTQTSAVINWEQSTSAPSNGYLYEVRTSGAAGSGATGLVFSGTTSSSTDTFVSLSSLTANTVYLFYVKSNCGAVNSVWSSSSTFRTGYCTPSPSSVDGTGITNVSFGVKGNKVNNTTAAESGNYGNFSTMVGFMLRGVSDTVKVTFNTDIYDYDTRIWIDLNNDFDFDDIGEEVFTGLSSTTSPNTLDCIFTIPGGTPIGNYRMRIGGRDASGGVITSCYTGTYGTIEDYTVKVVDVCDASANSVLASTTQSLLSAQCAEDVTGWVYYSPLSNPNALMFGINKTGSTLTGEFATLEILNTNPSSTSSSGINQEHGSFLMKRGWDVTSSSFTGSVSVRFFYDPADSASAIAARDADSIAKKTANSSSLMRNTPFEWFKSSGTPYNATWRALVIGNKFPSSHVKLTPSAYGTLNGVNYVEFSGITSFSGGSGGAGYGAPGAGGGVGLPVTWAGFDVKALETGNRLTWSTASEQNSDYFQVEYSYNGSDFTTVPAKIKAAGNSQVLTTYNSNHTDFNTFVYYRIKQVDMDGRTDYSVIKSVKRTVQPTFTVDIYPIPLDAKKELNLKVSAIDLSQLTIKMTDITGKVMVTKSIAPSSSIYTDKVDMSNMANGIYFIEVKNAQGKEVIKVLK